MWLEKTAGFIYQNIKHSPRPRCCHIVAVLRWPEKHAFRKAHQYSSWHLLQKYSPNGFTGCWCNDVPALIELWRVSQILFHL